jgi:hypothetical protein
VLGVGLDFGKGLRDAARAAALAQVGLGLRVKLANSACGHERAGVRVVAHGHEALVCADAEGVYRRS